MQFAASQINQGLWMLLGERVNFGEYLVETTIPLDSRLQCLSAMKDVYSGYVAGFSGPVENVFLMWWHLIIASAGWGENLIVNDEDQHLRSQAFTVLTEILAIPDPVCQRCALHGLGHLGHPERPRVVDEWLTENRPLLTPDTTAWVEQCRDGSVM
jgi:hypothetical protein